MDEINGRPKIRFLKFVNDEDVEKEAKLKEAAQKIEQAIAKDKALNELIDYVPPPEDGIDPLNDTRPLYERLLEQKNKKMEMFEESQKLSNLVSNLDEDEAEYLNQLAKTKREEELKKRLEVYDALEAKKRANERRKLDEEQKMKESLLSTKVSNKTSSHKSRLSSLIRVKPKMKPDSDQPSSSKECDKQEQPKETDNSTSLKSTSDFIADNLVKRQKTEPTNQVMTCIGVLPTMPIGKTHESSDSESDDAMESRIVPRIGKSKR